MIINSSPHFKRAYQNLPLLVQADFDKKITIFFNNPHHPSLKTHKLKGRLQECLSFYLRDGYRVLFEYAESNTINLLDVGPHDKYKTWKK